MPSTRRRISPARRLLDVDDDLAAPRGQGPGRHPLPTAEAFARAAGRAGIGADTHVIAYDASGGAYAARLWWLLRYFGHQRVSLLDGGWPAWQAAGYPTETEQPAIAPATFVAVPHPEMVVDAAAVDALRRDPRALMLDARLTERYEGRVEPIDPQAGHIPGARSAPYPGNLRDDGRMKSADDLRERYLALGADSADADRVLLRLGRHRRAQCLRAAHRRPHRRAALRRIVERLVERPDTPGRDWAGAGWAGSGRARALTHLCCYGMITPVRRRPWGRRIL